MQKDTCASIIHYIFENVKIIKIIKVSVKAALF